MIKKAVIFVFIIILSMTTALLVGYTDLENVSVGTIVPQEEQTETITVPNETKISFVGDVMLARQVETYLKKYGSDFVYSNLPPQDDTTILVGNFEATIALKHQQTPDFTFSFFADKSHIPALKDYGFDYVSLANNHSDDGTDEDFVHTQSVLTQNGVIPFGKYQGVGTSSIQVFDFNGIRTALIGLNTIGSALKISDIEWVLLKASTQSEMQIVYIHWGTEYQEIHSQEQEILARKLIDNGADLIVGHHPHVVQDIGIYKNVPIFYSLGNFIFDQYFSKEVQEGLQITMHREQDGFSYFLQGVTSIDSRTAPRLMNSAQQAVFLEDLAQRSDPVLQNMIRSGVITDTH